jgi:Flp pilus assembly protein TadB
MTFLRILPARVWFVLGVVAVVLLAFAAYKYQQHRADRAEAALAPAKVAVEALDTVATQTPIIRTEQKDKEREVEQIEGSDTRLPDGYGSALERVRRGERNRDSR